MLEFNEFALVVFFLCLCFCGDTKTIGLTLGILVSMYLLTTLTAQQYMVFEGMTTQGNTTSLTVYLLGIVLIVLFLKKQI